MWSLSTWYWSTLKAVVQLNLTIVTWIVPIKLLKKGFVDTMAKYRVKVVTEKEEVGKYDKKKYGADIFVKDNRFFKKVVNSGPLSLGEGYMDGWIEMDVYPFIATLARIFHPKERHILDYFQENKEMSYNQQTRLGAMKVIEEHYDLGNELYTKMLDPTMNYTCAYWKEDTKTLEEAQINKMDLVARKLKLKPGMKVLDLGCGFGAAAKYMAQKYGVSMVGYTISKEQIKYARESCKGLDCEFRLEDYREAKGSYDAVYSIGFFEAVGVDQFREYFEIVDRCLKDDGLSLLHTIALPDGTYPRTSEWTNKYIFPGGQAPHIRDFSDYSDGLFIIEDMHNFGYSYSKTLREWDKNFEAAWPELKPKYGPMMDGKFYRMWKFYLNFAAGVFDARKLSLIQVVYSKKGVEGGYDSVR